LLENKYVYGPVPSRRLGRSLGVDIVPVKVCTLDCIYCQIGKTTNRTIERKEYVPAEPVIAEIKQTLSTNAKIDYITIAGSGEPALNSQLGKIIEEIKKITSLPVAVLTNGTLLYMPDVRADCAKADVVLPSLDAGDEATFQKINRPGPDISIEKLISGLSQFRREYSGRIWLEVFLIESVNSGPEQISKISATIRRIRPDKVQLNTAVRPAAEKNVRKLNAEKLQEIAAQIGPDCEVIADFSRSGTSRQKHKQYIKQNESISETLFSMLKRRPCSLKDICSSMNMHQNEAIKYISELERQGRIQPENISGVVYFQVVSSMGSDPDKRNINSKPAQ
jgi:wyosine [tRNA(Phe)-imidazoG37] synthetase (radical SAM superfamily)